MNISLSSVLNSVIAGLIVVAIARVVFNPQRTAQ